MYYTIAVYIPAENWEEANNIASAIIKTGPIEGISVVEIIAIESDGEEDDDE